MAEPKTALKIKIECTEIQELYDVMACLNKILLKKDETASAHSYRSIREANRARNIMRELGF